MTHKQTLYNRKAAQLGVEPHGAHSGEKSFPGIRVVLPETAVSVSIPAKSPGSHLKA